MKKIINIDLLAVEETAPSEIWNQLLTAAVLGRVSDIHLGSQEDGVHISLRVDGQLHEQGVLFPMDSAMHLLNHIKVLAEIDLGERRRPQSGRAQSVVENRMVDLRISVLPTNHGQDIVIRLLDKTISLLPLESLGMSRWEYNRVMGLINAPSGLVLVTGPTGAGKTTTLYAILKRLNGGTRKIVTIENPIEFDLPGINQAQINERLGVDCGHLLRTVLQQDPDVIMIGEVRDSETAAAALRAAVTGHLVFATMHSVGAVSALQSFVGLGAHPHFLAYALRGVIAQNLVRRICPACTTRIPETESILPLDDLRERLSPDERPALSLGRGCDLCGQTGYQGRMGLFEVFVNDEGIRPLIEQQHNTPEIQKRAVEKGMMPIQIAGKLAAFRGETTVEELLRTVPWSPMVCEQETVAEVSVPALAESVS